MRVRRAIVGSIVITALSMTGALPVAAHTSDGEAAPRGLTFFAAQAAETGTAQRSGAYPYEITTVPPLEGIEIELDGRVQVTGPDGTATFQVSLVHGRTDSNVADRVIVHSEQLDLDDHTRALFSLLRPGNRSLTLQYTISYLTSFQFRDSGGERIPPKELDILELKSSVGEVLEVEPGVPVWLLGTRAAPAPGGTFDIKQVFWTVQDVQVDELSVVNRAQTKFFPEDSQEITVPLLFFSARFEVVDAFFGFPIGNSIELVAPNGAATEHELDASGRLELDQLARGEYTVIVHGPGLTLSRPVAVSRTQFVPLTLYSWLDLSVVAMVLAVFFLAPVVYGVRRRRRIDAAYASITAPRAVAADVSGRGRP